MLNVIFGLKVSVEEFRLIHFDSWFILFIVYISLFPSSFIFFSLSSSIVLIKRSLEVIPCFDTEKRTGHPPAAPSKYLLSNKKPSIIS